MDRAPQPTPRVAYLVNQYPKVSHTFIRREIQALERRGLTVQRYAVRGWADAVADSQDEAERAATRYLLQDGVGALLAPAVRALLSAPRRFCAALGLAWRMGRRADRARPYHLVYLLQACRLLEWMRQADARHLHAHFGTNPAEVAMLARMLGGPPYSFTVHGPEEFDKATVLGLAEKARHAAFVVAISSFGRSQLYRWIDARDWPKVQVVPCGIEPGFEVAADAKADAAAGGRRLVCVGRLSEQKGQLLLIEAVHRLATSGVELELVLAGDGDMRGAIEAEVARRGLERQVRITGWIASAAVRDEVLAARALVLASFAEGLPVVVMEAMALARAVVATSVAGVPELVVDGDTGWLVAAGDVDALATAMRACLECPAERLADMGRRGRARVMERHDVDRSAALLAASFAASAPT